MNPGDLYDATHFLAMADFAGVGLAAAIAARWGGWEVPVHCDNGAIVKFTCTNGAVASVAIWLKPPHLVYAAKVARKAKILDDHPEAVLACPANRAAAVSIYLTIRAVVGHHQAQARLFDSSALRWRPPIYELVATAVAVATARVDNAITVIRTTVKVGASHNWVVFGASGRPTAIEFTPSDVRVGRTITARFSPATYNLNADAWRGQPDCAAYVARIAAALATHFNT